MSTRYDAYPDHPLCGVPPEVLDAARGPVHAAAGYNDVDPDMADSIADAVVSVLHERGFIRWTEPLLASYRAAEAERREH